MAAPLSADSSRLDDLRALAADARVLSPLALHERVGEALGFLDTLLPVLATHDAALTPADDDRARLLQRDREEIDRLVARLRRHREELGSATLPVAQREIEADLYALHAVISLHLVQEEGVGQRPSETARTLPERDCRGSMAIADADGVVADGG